MTASVLITDRYAKVSHTLVRTRSAAEAPILGLKDYLETLVFPISGGDALQFAVVSEHKAEPDDLAEYPGACVYIEGEVDYGVEEGTLTPIYSESDSVEDCSLIQAGELKAEILIHAWANEVAHRTNLVMMLEDGMNPNEDTHGFILELPHYFNARCYYTMKQLEWEDNDSDNNRRYRKVGIRLEAHWPYLRMFRIPKLSPRSVVEIG